LLLPAQVLFSPCHYFRGQLAAPSSFFKNWLHGEHAQASSIMSFASATFFLTVAGLGTSGVLCRDWRCTLLLGNSCSTTSSMVHQQIKSNQQVATSTLVLMS
jgi:hypothetical protein